MFDPAWIYGCATGTSCNGGMVLDNRLACEPVTTMDACAPAPSCGIEAENASDIWFKFYPMSSSVTIACVQNTSMEIGIQAFDGGSCGSLTEKGCALSNGPSGGVKLTLNGLLPGVLYYFRVFGSSHSTPQRTGLYCFCGTTGLDAVVLSHSLDGLTAKVKDNKVQLTFPKPFYYDSSRYEIEYSADGVSYSRIYELKGTEMTANDSKATYMHVPTAPGLAYYRLKRIMEDGRFYYSSIVKVNLQVKNNITFDMAKKRLYMEVHKKAILSISDVSGRLLQSINLPSGLHPVSVANLCSGIYLVHNSETNMVLRIAVL